MSLLLKLLTLSYPVKEIATDPAVARRVFASFGKKLGAETEYMCIGAHRETDCLHGGDEAFELSARLFRRSGGMDRSGGIYGCLVSLCDKKDRERA